MELKIFTVFDSKAHAYLPPFFAPTVGLAARMFADAVNDKQEHPFAKHPADYTLFEIGHFDDENAKLHPRTPFNQGNGLIFVHQVEQLLNEPIKAAVNE